MNRLLFIASFLALTSPAVAALQEKEVSYHAGGTVLKGYLAWDDAKKGKRPGILVVHEWWGLNDYARRRARMLAAEGYTALALDMYGEGKTARHPEDAQKFASEVSGNEKLARARFEAALTRLQSEKTVDPEKIAAIGYCFGGSVVLDMARSGEPLRAVVSFHGGLSTRHPAEAGKIRARIASFSGEADPFISATQVAAFKKEMRAAGVDFEVVTYPGAKHSFTNPDADKYGKAFDLPLAYDAEADKDSWEKAMAFLADSFGSNAP